MTPTVEEITPHNLDAERAVLGAALVDGGPAIDAASSRLQPEDFFRDGHRRIFRKMLSLNRTGQPVDLVTLTDELTRSGEIDDVGGPVYISTLTDGMSRSSNVLAYADIVKRDSTKRTIERTLTRALHDLRTLGAEDALARAERAVTEASDQQGDQDEPLLEPVALVAARESTAGPRYLVPGLVFAGCVSLWFGHERTMKSIALRELAVACAMGRQAFHLRRLAVAEPVSVVYVTEEDSAGAVIGHLDAFSGGLVSSGGLPIYLSACKGITLDDPTVQDRLLRECAIAAPGLIILEPLRSLTTCVDQGPRELQPLTRFLRRLLRETGAAIALGHHAVKAVAGHDGRKGGQRVSGGGLLSIAEAPIEFSRIDEGSVQMTPRGFKHSATPAPLSLRLETASGEVSRLIAGEFAPPPDPDQEAEATVLSLVRAEPGMSSNAIAARARGRKTVVLEALRQLGQQGKLRAETNGRGTSWHPV